MEAIIEFGDYEKSYKVDLICKPSSGDLIDVESFTESKEFIWAKVKKVYIEKDKIRVICKRIK